MLRFEDIRENSLMLHFLPIKCRDPSTRPYSPSVARATLRMTGLYGIVESGQQLHSVNTKGKCLPRINTDDTDQAKTINHKRTRRNTEGKIGKGKCLPRICADER